MHEVPSYYSFPADNNHAGVSIRIDRSLGNGQLTSFQQTRQDVWHNMFSIRQTRI